MTALTQQPVDDPSLSDFSIRCEGNNASRKCLSGLSSAVSAASIKTPNHPESAVNSFFPDPKIMLHGPVCGDYIFT